jgi:hypothetical protein
MGSTEKERLTKHLGQDRARDFVKEKALCGEVIVVRLPTIGG